MFAIVLLSPEALRLLVAMLGKFHLALSYLRTLEELHFWAVYLGPLVHRCQVSFTSFTAVTFLSLALSGCPLSAY
jgi:hypothetical protein